MTSPGNKPDAAGAAHWDAVYGGRPEETLSWFEAEPGLSWELIQAHAAPGPAVDVGAGTSHLAEALIAGSYTPLTLLDLSGAALAATRARLGPRAEAVEFVIGDVTRWQPGRTYALWHDRAVFHFLTDAADRTAYLKVMERALGPGGLALIATFADDGPERCSGLPTRRYSPAACAAEVERVCLGSFEPVTARRHVHTTPAGKAQRFQISLFRKIR